MFRAPACRNAVADVEGAREMFRLAGGDDGEFAEGVRSDAVFGLFAEKDAVENLAVCRCGKALRQVLAGGGDFDQFRAHAGHVAGGSREEVALAHEVGDVAVDRRVVELGRRALLDDDGALEAFRKSVELDPSNAVAQYRLGAALLRKDNAAEAVRHLSDSYRLNRLNQSTLYSLQIALRQNGQAEEADKVKRELAQLLREIDTESQNAFTALRLNNEGAELEKRGDLRAALDKYREAATLDRSHAGFRMNLGVALLRLGRWKEGLDELREGSRLDPENKAIRAALDDALDQAPVEFGGKGGAARRSK